MKHTPGPWKSCDEDCDGNYLIEATDDMGGSVAETYDAANAKLIAAAPELLEALQAIVRDWDGEPEDMAAANAAIAKATR